MNVEIDEMDVLRLAVYRMPFGRYKDMRLIDIPEAYYVWFMRKGLPEGELGHMMAAAYEIKVNGLESLFDQLR